MDSLTQSVLGAAIGEICLGKKLGWKASIKLEEGIRKTIKEVTDSF